MFMNADENKFIAAMGKIGREIKRTLCTKRAGFYVGAAAWVLTLAHTFTYTAVPKELFNGSVILCSVLGLVLFAALSLFTKTSSLAPIALMVCDFLCITSFAAADGIVDYFSTQFFDGFSLSKLFALPMPVWFSILSFVISFLLSLVAIFLPQNKSELRATERSEKDTSASAAGGTEK